MNLKNQLEDIGPANTPHDIDSVVVPKSKKKLFLPVIAGIVVVMGMGGMYIYKTLQHAKQQQANGFNAAMAQQGVNVGAGMPVSAPALSAPGVTPAPNASTHAPGASANAPIPFAQSNGANVPGLPGPQAGIPPANMQATPANTSQSQINPTPAGGVSHADIVSNQVSAALPAPVANNVEKATPGMLVTSPEKTIPSGNTQNPQPAEETTPCTNSSASGHEDLQKEQDKVMGVKSVKHPKWKPRKKSGPSVHDDDAVTSEQILIVQ